MARASAAEKVLAERETFLRGVEEDRARWMARASAAAGLEADRADWIERCAQLENQLLNSRERLCDASTLLEEREEELASIRASATWRWSRRILGSGPIQWLFGTVIHFVATRYQRGALRRSAYRVR